MLLLIMLAGAHQFFIRMENSALDSFYRLRGAAPAPDDFLVVAIDESSFQDFQLPWPWPRSLHAALVDRLHSAGARLIVMDIIFAEPSNDEDDQRLAASLRESGHVVLAQALEVVDDPVFFRTIRIDPMESLRQAAQGTGLAVLTPDSDGVIRRFSVQYGGYWTLPGASLLALAPETARAKSSLTGLIDYVGPSRTMRTVSYSQVLDPEYPLPDGYLRGKYVFVGLGLAAQTGSQQMAESFATPFLTRQGGFMPGVEIQANILHTLLSGQAGREVSLPTHAGLAAVMLGLTALLAPRQKPLAGLAVMLGLTASFLVLVHVLFDRHRVWIEPVRILAGCIALYGLTLLADYFAELKAKIHARKALSRYLAPTVVDQVLREPEKISLGGEEVQATVMMADLSGFTALTEDLPPTDIIALLEEFFTPATEIITQEGGTLDKYIGDAIMAFWGAPLHVQDHAPRAARSALAVCGCMDELRRRKQDRGRPFFGGVRVGLHSGRVVVGNVGSSLRHDYTCLGDTVNLTARLESLNKQYGTRILVSGDTRRLLGGEFLLRHVDTVRVFGRAQALSVHELLGDGRQEAPGWIEPYDQARRDYERGSFHEAALGFEHILKMKPDDGPSRTLLARCRLFLDSPPRDWDGIFTLDKK